MAQNEEQISNTTGSQKCYDLFKEFIIKLSELLKPLNPEDIQDLKTKIENKKEGKTQSEDGSDEENKNKGKEKPWLDKAIEAISNEDEYERKKKLFIYALWLWYMPISNIPASTKNENLKKVDKNLFNDLSNEGLLPFRVNGLASYGQGIVHMKSSILFLLDLFESIKSSDEDNITEENIENMIIKKYGNEDTSIKNMLLHLCDPDNYEPIANSNHKEQIVNALGCLLEDQQQKNIDTKIKLIKILFKKRQEEEQKRKQGNHHHKKTISFDFYQDEIKYLWMNTDLDNKLSDIQMLEYKKAMVLYGPPGTGKTYSAKLLANSLVKRYFINRGSLPKEDEIKKHIAYLQFHVNYNYEDFIAGQTIEDSTVKTKKGFIFNVIDKAKQAPDVPYVVILDEMNRTDVSRVFGELFTAIEKRGEDVELSLPDPINKRTTLTLNLPENIYFIGTMNEIDFSLERIDFALRRRFIWQECGYSEEDLKDMIYHLFEKTIYPINNTDIANYCDNCTVLNEMIKSKMDETYHIGHSFFAEIVNIYSKLKDNCINDKTWSKAKNILWQISIKPTLDAYCGTMSEEEKKQVMPDFEKAFFPEKKQEKAK